MAAHALFAGLVFDEADQPLTPGFIGAEAAYILNDAGFHIHIPAEKIDRQVLAEIKKMIAGNESLLSAEAAKLLGADDLFSKAVMENQLRNIDQQFETLFQVGIPEEMRTYLGMTGFKVRVDYHGEVIEIHQAGTSGEEE
jgi:hypothetical protein